MSETNWERTFGTPEKAAESLTAHFANCNKRICMANDYTSEEWLKWMQSEDMYALLREVDA